MVIKYLVLIFIQIIYNNKIIIRYIIQNIIDKI